MLILNPFVSLLLFGNVYHIHCCLLVYITLDHLFPQNDAPPPYSVAVHPQPPLRPYEEVVYGNMFTVPTYIHPHYIPQHAPVITTAVTQQSLRELVLFLVNEMCPW